MLKKLVIRSLILSTLIFQLGCKDDDSPDTTFTGSISLDSNEKLRDFGKEGYQVIKGSLIIGAAFGGVIDLTANGNEIADLDSILGDLRILNTRGLRDLSLLKNIRYVGGSIEVYQNINLSSFEGLENLLRVNESIEIVNNPVLQRIEGLSNLSGEIENLTIADNSFLESLAGLEDIFSAETIVIQNNNNLKNLNGLDGLKYVFKHLIIRGNSNLKNLHGLNNLTTAPHDSDSFVLEVRENIQQESLAGLGQLARVHKLSLDQLPALDNLNGLQNLLRIDKELMIRKLVGIKSLNGLNTQINVPIIRIILNDQLEDIWSLRGITQLDIIQINSNPHLTNLWGLQNMATIKEILINTNHALKDLCALSRAVGNINDLKSYSVLNNLFNPTLSDFSSRNCSR